MDFLVERFIGLMQGGTDNAGFVAELKRQAKQGNTSPRQLLWRVESSAGQVLHNVRVTLMALVEE
jgi:hypothetical protein